MNKQPVAGASYNLQELPPAATVHEGGWETLESNIKDCHNSKPGCSHWTLDGQIKSVRGETLQVYLSALSQAAGESHDPAV